MKTKKFEEILGIITIILYVLPPIVYNKLVMAYYTMTILKTYSTKNPNPEKKIFIMFPLILL